MGSISFRRSIQWLPDDPAPVEPTSTVVLTSPEKRFVDIRILLPDSGGGGAKRDDFEIAHENYGTITLSSLDWAFAGTSESQSLPSTPDGGPTTHSKWHHLVTDRAAVVTPGQFTDEGDMYPQPDGSVLEKGRMVNPATGRETDYEEVWLDGEPGEIPTSSGSNPHGGHGERTCIVLEAHNGNGTVTGMVVCLGRFCQAVVRQGERFGLERWSCKGSDSAGDAAWECRADMRSGLWTPASEVCKKPGKHAVGDVIQGREGGDNWTVVEVC